MSAPSTSSSLRSVASASVASLCATSHAGGFGFIKSVSSVAEVYFHLSALVLLASDGHAPPS
jgi:hypothetical protein